LEEGEGAVLVVSPNPNPNPNPSTIEEAGAVDGRNRLALVVLHCVARDLHCVARYRAVRNEDGSTLYVEVVVCVVTCVLFPLLEEEEASLEDSPADWVAVAVVVAVVFMVFL